MNSLNFSFKRIILGVVISVLVFIEVGIIYVFLNTFVFGPGIERIADYIQGIIKSCNDSIWFCLIFIAFPIVSPFVEYPGDYAFNLTWSLLIFYSVLYWISRLYLMLKKIDSEKLIESSQIDSFPYANFGMRVKAFLVDSVIISIPFLIAGSILNNISLTLSAVEIIVIIIYNVGFITRYGATPGKMLLKIKVISIDGKNVSFGQALLREAIGKLVSGILLSAGFYWVIVDSRKQGWHDKIAKTIVVKKQ